MSKRSSLGVADIRSVFRLLNEMSELKHDQPASRHHLIHGLCGLLKARQGSLMKFDQFTPTGTPRLTDFAGGGWASPEAARLWEQAMAADNWRGDPVLNQATKMPGDACAFRRCELVSDRDYYGGFSFNVIAKTAGVDDTMVAWFREKEQGRVTGLAFQRAFGERGFSSRQREMLQLVTDELRLLYDAGKLTPTPIAAPALPPRLLRVFTELLTGKSEKQIAATLQLSRPELMAIFIRGQ